MLAKQAILGFSLANEITTRNLTCKSDDCAVHDNVLPHLHACSCRHAMARLCHDGLVIRHHSQLPEVQLKGEFQVAVGSTGKTATPTNLHYVLAIDTSGSMAGSAIRQVNEALDAIFDNLASATHAVSVHMVEYNHQAQRHMFLESKPSALYGSGSTSFQAAFRALGQLVEELHGSEALKPGDNLRICFMTDGEDNCGGVESAYRSLQGQLLKLKVHCTHMPVHVVCRTDPWSIPGCLYQQRRGRGGLWIQPGQHIARACSLRWSARRWLSVCEPR